MKKLALLALGLMMVFSMGVFAEDTKKADDPNKAVLAKVGEGVIDIKFENVSFTDGVKQLAEKLGVKMVIDDSIKDAVKDVKLNFKGGGEIPVPMLMKWLCKQAAGVTYEVKDGAVVFTKGEAKGGM